MSNTTFKIQSSATSSTTPNGTVYLYQPWGSVYTITPIIENNVVVLSPTDIVGSPSLLEMTRLGTPLILSPDTYSFTLPLAGKYQIDFSCTITAQVSGSSGCSISLGLYHFDTESPFNLGQGALIYTFQGEAGFRTITLSRSFLINVNEDWQELGVYYETGSSPFDSVVDFVFSDLKINVTKV